MRPLAAALLIAAFATAAPLAAACARAQAADAFEEIPIRRPSSRPHAGAYLVGALGAALVAGSFPLAHAADRRYALYLAETDPTRISDRFDATVRMDRLSSGALLGGEALLATAIWMRFIRHPDDTRVALRLENGRCAVSCRF